MYKIIAENSASPNCLSSFLLSLLKKKNTINYIQAYVTASASSNIVCI